MISLAPPTIWDGSEHSPRLSSLIWPLDPATPSQLVGQPAPISASRLCHRAGSVIESAYRREPKTSPSSSPGWTHSAPASTSTSSSSTTKAATTRRCCRIHQKALGPHPPAPKNAASLPPSSTACHSRQHPDLVCMDADLSHPPKPSPHSSKALENEADFVIGSRYIAGGSTEDWSRLRWINSAGATALASPLTGTSKTPCPASSPSNATTL